MLAPEHRHPDKRVGHLEQLEQVFGVADELVEAVDGDLQRTFFLAELLRVLRVVPEARLERVVGQSFDLETKAVDVKETSPALPSAERVRARRRELR